MDVTGFDKAGYVYNWKNQLMKVSTGTGVNIEYKYDALGRRTAKIIKTPENQTVLRYVHDGYRVIEERDGQDMLKYRYTYGNGIDERIEMEKRVVKPDGTVAYKSYYLLHDSIGNVIGLTNAAGLLIEKYKYNPYGKVKFYNTENSPKVDSITIRDGKIKLYFDRAVDINNIDIHVVIIGNQQQIPVDIESSRSGRQYLLAPESGPLPQDEPLNIKVESKEDSSGTSFADQTTLLLSQDFVYHGGAIEVIHDQGAPRVESVTHEGNELLIEFNEDVKPASLSDHIELAYQGTTINGSIAIIGDNQAKFTPDEPLSDTKQYSVKVSNVEDYAGKVIELFSLDFELNVESKLLFSYSILTGSTHSIVGNNSLMHGRDYEPEIGLYYYRARYYHPELGRFLQPDPMGYEDSMNLYQAFGMNPANFVDPFGNEISSNTLRYWGNYDNALEYIKYNYGLYLAGGDSPDKAYRKLVKNGLVTDNGSSNDHIFALKLALSPSFDVFDVTPAQFGKDVLGGLTNGFTSMVSFAVKGLPGGYNPHAWAQIDNAQNWIQSKANTVIGANEGSLGYWMGSTYGPVIAGAYFSAELKCLNATAQTQKTLPFKTIPKLRQQYVDEVLALKEKIPTLEKAGMTQEEIARTIYSERNALKIKYRTLTPKNLIIEIENRCINKYGNKLGPTIEQLRAKGKTWEQIIESATRTGGLDLGF